MLRNAMGPGSAEQRVGRCTASGTRENLLSPPSADLPVGRLVDRRVQPPLQKYFTSPVGQIISTNSPHPTPQEGRIMAVAKRGVGCGGRGSVLRAMGSQGGFRPVSDHKHADERCCCVRQNRVVLTPRRWRQVLRSCVGSTGLRQNISARRRWQKKPGRRLSHAHIFLSAVGPYEKRESYQHSVRDRSRGASKTDGHLSPCF